MYYQPKNVPYLPLTKTKQRNPFLTPNQALVTFECFQSLQQIANHRDQAQEVLSWVGTPEGTADTEKLQNAPEVLRVDRQVFLH